MRVSRKQYLPQFGAMVHKFWRAHNKEFRLDSSKVKELYLNQVAYALKHKSVGEQVNLHAFCLMGNHSHQLVSYNGKSDNLSSYMRIAHSGFGQKLNRMEDRQGAVAYDRPKTPVIQPSSYHEMRVHFYIEANPLRAKMTKNLKTYQFSSFKFYAWGVKDKFTALLVPPAWYIKLGKTWKKRQAKYRALFEKYLKELLQSFPGFIHSKFIGDVLWVFKNSCRSLNKTIAREVPSQPPD